MEGRLRFKWGDRIEKICGDYSYPPEQYVLRFEQYSEDGRECWINFFNGRRMDAWRVKASHIWYHNKRVVLTEIER